MKTISPFLLILCACFCAVSLPAKAQLFVGAGPVYSLPQGDFADFNQSSVGGTLFVGSRKYCNLWSGLRLDYIPYSAKDVSTSLTSFGEAFMLSPELRYFFQPGN